MSSSLYGLSSTSSVYVVHGPPGCGKTTYLGQKVREAAGLRGPEAVMVVSLTRAAASEIAGRKLPIRKDRVGTLHAHAYRALGSPEIAEVHAGEWSTLNPVYKVAAAGRGAIDEASSWDDGEGTEFGEKALLNYTKLRALQVPREDKQWLSVRGFAERWEAWKRDTGYLDFEDLIEIAGRDCTQAPGKPELIYGDEAQDFSRSEMALLLKWGAAKGCDGLIIVGDFDQAIYEFRGADPQIIRRLEVPPERRKVLEQSWRVPRAVHALAVRWIKQVKDRDPIAYQPRDFDGRVRIEPILTPTGSGEAGGTNYRRPEQIAWEIERLLSAEPGKTVMVIASCAFMLKPLASVLKKAGIPFHNPYCPKRGDWNPLRSASRVTDFLRTDPETWGAESRFWNWEELDHWLDMIAVNSAGMTKGAKAEVERLARDERLKRMKLEPADVAALFETDNPQDTIMGPDRAQWVRFFEGHGLMRMGDGSIEINPLGGDPRTALQWLVKNTLLKKRRLVEYPARIAERFGGKALLETPRVTLSTIHGCKGGEADHVLVCADLSPRGAREWDQFRRDAIIRLFYVAFTRARETLTILAPANTKLAVRGYK